MARTITTRTITLISVICAVLAMLALTISTTLALPAYTTATGQPCSACHVNPAGGGTLTAAGQRFAAVPNHASNAAAAWASLSAPAPAPAPSAPSAPSAPPAAAPADQSAGKAGGAPAGGAPAGAATGGGATSGGATSAGTWTGGPMTVMLSGAMMDSTVAYTVMLRNTGNTDILNSYLALSLPAGATMSGNPTTPEGATFVGQGGGAAWIINDIPASSANTGVIGPFVFTLSGVPASSAGASAFVHWLRPSEGSFSTPVVMPITNDERMAIEQQVINRFNTVDRNTELWNIQPGLGTVMIEYNNRFDNLWFAAQAGNWDMVRYQIAEMIEIQEVAEVTRPSRAAPLKAFENGYLDPMDEVAQTKNLEAFVQAYDNAITGCNNCHAASTGLPPNRDITAKFIKVMRPTAPVFPNVDWRGAQ